MKKIYIKAKTMVNKSISLIIYWVLKALNIDTKYKNVWIIGGSSGLQYKDNSATFHKYILNNHTNMMVYWVIDKRSVDVQYLKKSDVNIVYKNSIKANLLALLSQVQIVTHGPKDVTPYSFRKHNNTLRVNLGHGIQGLKKIKADNKKLNILNLDFDVFINSSNSDKEIKRSWGIDNEKLYITGLPRYDDLLYKFDKMKKINKRKFLYMPTWREWLTQDDEFYNTTYYMKIKELLGHDEFYKLLKIHNITLYVYLHVNMHKYFDKMLDLQNEVIKFISPYEDIQNEILDSEIFITDYSSVCWDFIYLDKPVIFYRFDIDEYNENRGSYYDLYDDKFGPVSYNAEDLLSFINSYLNNSLAYKIKEDEKKELFKYIDTNNCKRVFNIIENNIK